METAETAHGERTAVCKWHPWCVLSFDSWEEKASVLHSTYIWVWFFIFYKEKALACCLNMHACTSVHGHTRTAKAWIEATPCFCYWGFSAAPSAVLPQGSSREEKGHERHLVVPVSPKLLGYWESNCEFCHYFCTNLVQGSRGDFTFQMRSFPVCRGETEA